MHLYRSISFGKIEILFYSPQFRRMYQFVPISALTLAINYRKRDSLDARQWHAAATVQGSRVRDRMWLGRYRRITTITRGPHARVWRRKMFAVKLLSPNKRPKFRTILLCVKNIFLINNNILSIWLLFFFFLHKNKL